MSSNKSLLVVVAFCFATCLQANTPTPAELAANHQFDNAKLSPDGQHIAMVLIEDDKRKLAVIKTQDLSLVGGADFGKVQQVGDFHWANSERLVMQILEHDPWAEQARNYGELFAIDFNGKGGDIVYGYRGGESQFGNLRKQESIRGWAEIINLLPNEEDQILISSEPMSTDGRSQKTIHKLNIKTGRLSSVIAGAPLDTENIITDKNGELKLAVGINKDFERVVYKFDGEQFVEFSEIEFGGAFYVHGIDAKGESLFYTDNIESNTDTLYRLSFANGKRTAIFNDPNVDITRVITSTQGNVPIGVELDNGYPSYQLLNSNTAEEKVFESLTSAFKGFNLRITSRDYAGENWIILASNEVTPGKFYLYNSKRNDFRLLFTRKRSIESSTLSPSFPFSFTASDGVSIPAYITYPISIPETQSVPLVVLVHGGPILRDYWAYNRQVQMLASRGYAVLRVNFRGSDGYGSAFRRMSQQNWGTRMQQDIIEGTRFAIESGGILKDKICIVGASFGAYSAVMSATRAPDLFKCVVANAGVYDLALMFEEGNIKNLLYGKAYLSQQLSEDPAVLKAQSPINHVPKLKAPVLLAHGGEDTQVPVNHAYALKAALDANNKEYEWYFNERAGHGFFEEQSRIAYYEKVAQFLQQNLK